VATVAVGGAIGIAVVVVVAVVRLTPRRVH